MRRIGSFALEGVVLVGILGLVVFGDDYSFVGLVLAVLVVGIFPATRAIVRESFSNPKSETVMEVGEHGRVTKSAPPEYDDESRSSG